MLVSVKIVFENCESLKLEAKDIRRLYFNDIKKCAYAYNLPHFSEESKDTFSGFHELESADTIIISLYKEALKNKKTKFGKDDESDAIERLKFGDITQVHIYGKDVNYWYLFKGHIRIPKPFAKKYYYKYFVNYKAENPDKLGSPNIYQKFEEEKLSNYYEDEVITITIDDTEELKNLL